MLHIEFRKVEKSLLSFSEASNKSNHMCFSLGKPGSYVPSFVFGSIKQFKSNVFPFTCISGNRILISLLLFPEASKGKSIVFPFFYFPKHRVLQIRFFFLLIWAEIRILLSFFTEARNSSTNDCVSCLYVHYPLVNSHRP